MLISITVIFGILWFPIKLVLMIQILDHTVDCWELYDLTKYIAHVIAMSSTCYNPLLYGLMNSAFRTEFAKLWSCARIINATKYKDHENDPRIVEERIECTTGSTDLSQ